MEEELVLLVDPTTQLVTVDTSDPSVSAIWDATVQFAAIEASDGPTITARSFSLMHTAMFDAWAQYDPTAVAVSVGDDLQRPIEENTDANKIEAMSYAALTVLGELYPEASETIANTMTELGFDPTLELPAEGSPAAVGLAVGAALMDQRRDDGSNQVNDYADTTGYAPVNASPLSITDISRWTPESVPIDPEDDAPEQSFLTPHWGAVEPFGLSDGAVFRPEAPQPFFVEGVIATLDIDAGEITLEDGTVLPVTSDLVGTVINPGFIAQTEEVISFSGGLTDEQKLIAEFWEDGGGTSFPPGTWMTFAQYISARDDNSVDQDALLFFAMANAVFDAGIATWEAKVHYDYVRPVRAVRELGSLGLIGEEGTDSQTGETGFVIEAWAGPGLGTQTILAENFLTYQTPDSDVSPPFAEYTSGHSSFSAAGAQILLSATGSEDFGASVTLPAGTSRFEPGVTPVEDVTLAWDTFSASADEGGISRLYGGIHFTEGDLNGRELGRDVGRAAWSEALFYATGAAGADATTPEAPEEVLTLARFYSLTVGRVIDPLGLNFWVDALASIGEAGVADAFLLSSEFEQNFGSAAALSDEALIDALLDNVQLGAEEGSDLVTGVLADLAAGGTRSAALITLAESAEVTDRTTYLNGLTELEPGVWGYA
ncbi:MAG: DUF6851 domain-containing protein [Pseudomonadota bacterium]